MLWEEDSSLVYAAAINDTFFFIFKKSWSKIRWPTLFYRQNNWVTALVWGFTLVITVTYFYAQKWSFCIVCAYSWKKIHFPRSNCKCPERLSAVCWFQFLSRRVGRDPATSCSNQQEEAHTLLSTSWPIFSPRAFWTFCPRLMCPLTSQARPSALSRCDQRPETLTLMQKKIFPISDTKSGERLSALVELVQSELKKCN